MRRSKVYIDSNIWIQYLWIKQVTSIPREFSKENLKRKRCFELISNDKTSRRLKIIVSLFNESEISGYFRDYLRFVRGLSAGFDYTNSHRYKESFLLTKGERKEITFYFEHIATKKFVEVVKIESLDSDTLDFFRSATCEYDLDYMDTFHLIAAMINGCKFLITDDNDFRNKANAMLKNEGLSKFIKLINVKEAQLWLTKL